MKKTSMRTKHAKLSTQSKTNQPQGQLDWVVRHCSPNTIVYDYVDDDSDGHQPDPLGFSDWCAPVDWRCVRLKDTD